MPHALQPAVHQIHAKASIATNLQSAPLISPFGPLSEPHICVIGDRRTTAGSMSLRPTNEESNSQLEGDRTVDRRVRLWFLWDGKWESPHPHQENPRKLINTYFIYSTCTKDAKTSQVGAAAISFIHFRGPTHIL